MVSASESGSATIIVVDDDPEVREVVAEFLADSGHHILQAGGGREALQLLADTQGVDLVITDVRMPDISGLELVDIATRTRRDLKVILISGYFVAEETGRRVLHKPFRMQDLARAVREELAA